MIKLMEDRDHQVTQLSFALEWVYLSDLEVSLLKQSNKILKVKLETTKADTWNKLD
jgi:hypothetical protein